jgi:predicted metal-dependent peptidase
MAIDYIVNWVLRENNIGRPVPMTLYDPRYTDAMSSEEVYEIIIKEIESGALTVGVSWDEHLDGELAQGTEKTKGGFRVTERSDGINECNSPPDLTEEEKEAIREKIQEDIINASQICDPSDIPAGIRRIIEELTNPRMDWRTLLATQIQSTIRHDYTFQRPSRRSWHQGVIMPGQSNGKTINIAVAIDSSGSMSDEMLRNFLSEIKGIMELYRATKFIVHLWTFDTKCYGYHQFSNHNIRDIDTYEILGGGGTIFPVNWTFMRKKQILPNKFILFTDMMPHPGHGWGEEDYCDVIFINHGNKGIAAPFGITADYE